MQGRVHERLLNDLDQRRLAAFASRYEKRDVPAAAQFRHHEVHHPHTGIQSPGTVAASAVIARWAMCVLFRAHDAGDFRLHKLLAQLLQHTEHRVRLTHTAQ